MIKTNVDLLTEKGVYLYNYVSSIEKFNETKLPPKSELYTRLNNEDISDDHYKRAQNVWGA